MFWSRSGKTANAATSAGSSSSSSRRHAQNPQAPAMAGVPPPPSYVLSEQRRSELLLAARTNRVSWVDGVDEGHAAALARQASRDPLDTAALAASGLPTHCQQALQDVGSDLSRFFSSLDELKHKIVANDMQLSEDPNAGPQSDQKAATAYHTLFQELREHEAILNQWQHSHTAQTRRLTGHDREMAFLLGFRELVALLKNPQAAEVVYRIQSFVNRAEQWDLPLLLRAVATRDRPGGRIQAFIDKLVEQIKHSSKLQAVLRGGGNPDEKFLRVGDEVGEDLLHEVLEAFLMEKLYAQTLTPSTDSKLRDEALHDRIASLSFVSFEHLDLKPPQTEDKQQAWDRLVQQLRNLTRCPSPRRKMDGVLRVCQDLTTLLKEENNGKFPSADGFLPALIYLLLRANPPELKRNVAFILEYRCPSKLVSEPGYFFTHLVSSVAFLEEVNGSLLTISPEEFEDGLRRSREGLGGRKVTAKTVEQSDADREEAGSSKSSGSRTSSPRRALRKKLDQQTSNQREEADDSEEENELRLPDVLEVRARRLALLEQAQ